MKRLLGVLVVFTTISLSACTKEDKLVINYDDYVRDVSSDYSVTAKKDEFTYRKDYSSFDDYIVTNLDYKKEATNIDLEEVIEKSLVKKEKMLEDNLKFYEISKDDIFGSTEYRTQGIKRSLLKKEDMRSYMTNRNYEMTDKPLTRKDALEDLKFLDLLFRSYYDNYKVTGREKFNDSYNRACKAIDNLGDNFRASDFFYIVKNSYDAIENRHFRWYDNSESLYFKEHAKDGYLCMDYEFLKDDKGYYLKNYLPKTYLEMIEGSTNLDDYMKYSINNEGEIIYYIGTLDREQQYNKTMDVVIDETMFSFKCTLLGEYGNTDRRELYSFTLEEGYPVVMIKHYRGEGIDFSHYEKVGKALKNQAVIIHDARDNWGGSPENISAFYDNVFKGLDTASRCIDGTGGAVITPEEHLRAYFFTPWKEIYKNNNLFINLSDNNAGSGGDIAAVNVNQLSRALNIGEPTYGSLFASPGYPYVLPNSGMIINIPSSIDVVSVDMFMNEGRGNLPDIYVPTKEALDKTLKMLEYYDVKPSEDAKSIVERLGKGTNNISRVDLSDSKDYVNGTNRTCILDTKAMQSEDKLYLSIGLVEVSDIISGKGKIFKNYLIKDTFKTDLPYITEKELNGGSDKLCYLVFDTKDIISNMDKYNQVIINNQDIKFRVIPNVN